MSDTHTHTHTHTHRVTSNATSAEAVEHELALFLGFPRNQKVDDSNKVDKFTVESTGVAVKRNS